MRTAKIGPDLRLDATMSVAFVLTFNPNLPSINRLIKKHFSVLQSSPKFEELFQANSIINISSFLRPKNLKEILAPSKGRKSSLSMNTDTPAPGLFQHVQV